jgi:hypothetical protein
MAFADVVEKATTMTATIHQHDVTGQAPSPCESIFCVVLMVPFTWYGSYDFQL